jgi:hypothetical protein
MKIIDGSVIIIADSLNTVTGDRLTTFQISFPKCLLAELNTHRVLSRNAGSSRAKPSKMLRRSLREKSFVPLSWDANEPGMQSSRELIGYKKQVARFSYWLHKQSSIFCNWLASDVAGLHKQYSNRLLETHAYVDVVVSATEWNNFFRLRCHKDAQPEFREVALKMKKLYDANQSKKLKPGDWHIPYIQTHSDFTENTNIDDLVKYSVARCARVSYTTFDGNKIDVEKDLQLFEKLVESEPIHSSPTEHQAMACESKIRCGNFVGFKQYRKFLINESGGDYL